MEDFINKILNIIYPPVCGVCGKINKDFLCIKCKNRLDAHLIARLEIIEEKYFDEHLYCFKYEGFIRKIILDYKFNEKSYLYKTIVNFLLKNENIFQILESYDTIIPVPISNKRKKQRGYNQSFLIAEEISKKLQLNLVDNVLLKTKDIIEQSKLNKENRENNIINAYTIKNGQKINNKNIILIDDIYTTGSTVNECSRMLKMANTKKILVFTLAKD